MEKLYLNLFRRNDRVHRFKQKSKIAVSYFQNRRWRFVTLAEELSRSSPYQRKLKQYPLQFINFFILSINISALTNKLMECMGVDIDLTIECCLAMLFIIAVFVKNLFAAVQQLRRRRIYERIVDHFETITDPEEAAVLNEAAEHGFKYSLYYISGISMLVAIYGGIPILRAFYRYFFNNCELNVQLPIPMNFGFDHRKYWYIIAIDVVTCICTNLVVNFAFDLSFVLQVRHVAALFTIVGIRLGKALELIDESENETVVSDDTSDKTYSLISSAIDLHSECFKVVKIIEKSYTTSWFVILLLSTGSFGADIYLISTKLHDPIETFRNASGFMLAILHYQMIFSQGQIIIDSAESVLDVCCKCKWYGLPKESRQLLLMMTIRASMPCTLTGAKLFPLSMESFSKMLKAGLSYYTVFNART